MPIPVVTAQEMSNIDNRAIQEYGIPSTCLMEAAGLKSAQKIWEKYGRAALRVLIVCGKGNNGGDGFVVARHLLNAGADVDIATLFPLREVTGDPGVFLKSLDRMRIPILEVAEDNTSLLEEMGKNADLVVDAILGTGFRPPARGLAEEAVRILSAIDIPIVAIDMPSGLDSTTGRAELPYINAKTTLALGALKRGHLLMPAAEHVGEVISLDIGIPHECLKEEDISLHVTEPSDVAENLPERRPDAHKGDAGHLLLVAGAPGMSGAALMTAMSALRTGAGRVTLAVPESISPLVESKYPEIMTLSLPATESGSIDASAFDFLVERSEDMNALVIGPGLQTNPRTIELVHLLIQHIDAPVVLDADGLNALAQDLTILDGRLAQLILTPHPGEMARLLGLSTQEVQEDRITHANSFASHHHLDIALKGWGTIVATSDGEIWYNPTGNSNMATAGSGDVLAGVIGALLAQGLSRKWSLICGVYLHGMSGELASSEVGGLGITATDILQALPKARRKVLMEAGDSETV
ncbi:MAG: NAD(P)H-hydrate dehydratase [Nitrospinae bacterium]|nr:NAD(P)H-hydrate dehydratase [Nitrospinota bacterium]